MDAGDGAGDGAFVVDGARVDEYAFVRVDVTFGIVYNVVDDAFVDEYAFVVKFCMNFQSNICRYCQRV